METLDPSTYDMMVFIQKYPRLFLLFLSIPCLLPFIHRPVFVDDHAHFHQAIQRGQHPTNLYSGGPGELGWTKGEAPTEANGPVYFYSMGFFTRLFGTEEWKAHLLIFTLTFFGLLGFFDLAKRFTPYPVWASLLWLTTPHIWLTANSLLLDALLAPLLFVGLSLFMRGWETDSHLRLISGSLLLSLAPLVKYTGVLGLVIAIAWILYEKRGFNNFKLFHFLIPILIIGAWLIFTHTLYAQSHFSAVFKSSIRTPSFFTFYTLLAFLSGTTLFIIVPVILLPFSSQVTPFHKISSLTLFISLFSMGVYLFPLNNWVGIQLGFWAAVGGVWIYSIGALSFPKFSSGFLCLWLYLGLLGLLFARGWICARYFVVVSGPLILLNIWFLQKTSASWLNSFSFRLITVTVLIITSFILAFSDYKEACVGKELAGELNKLQSSQPIYYPAAAITGLGYYLDSSEFKPIDFKKSLEEGEQVVLPMGTLPERFYPRISSPQLIKKWEFPSFLPFRTVGSYSGFYGSIWGPLPFSMSFNPMDVFLLVQNSK